MNVIFSLLHIIRIIQRPLDNLSELRSLPEELNKWVVHPVSGTIDSNESVFIGNAFRQCRNLCIWMPLTVDIEKPAKLADCFFQIRFHTRSLAFVEIFSIFIHINPSYASVIPSGIGSHAPFISLYSALIYVLDTAGL